MHPERDPDLAPRLGPRFEWIRHLGRGGHGRVELVRDRMRDQDVALKLLVGARAPAGASDLKREFRVIRDLSHPNLVTMLELVLSPELECILLEFVEGVDLHRWIGATSPAEPTVSRTRTVADVATDDPGPAPGAATGASDRGRLVDGALQIVDALAFLEARGLVHGDLKPANVMVDRTGRVVVLDFGIARITGGPNARTVGTLAYMAPEQLELGREISGAADRYALGVLLYEALRGFLPFVGTAEQVRRAKRQGLSWAGEGARGTPDPLLRLAIDLLAPRPEERPDLGHVRGILGVERPRREAGPRRAGPRAGASFVGREAELRRLRVVVRAAGPTPILVLVGAPGLGKTSVLDRLCEGEPARVVRSRCYANESIRWNAIDALVDELVASGALDAAAPDRLEALALLFPHLGPHRGLHGGPRAVSSAAAASLTAVEQVRRAARELGLVLRRCGRTVVVVDDAQWADADSLGFLSQLVAEDPAIALVVAMRGPDARSRGIATRFLAAGRGVEVEELGPLGEEEMQVLARSLEVDPLALAATRGVPFLIEALAWSAGGSMTEADGTHQLFDARLAGASPSARRVLDLLAVNEAPLDTRVLVQIDRETSGASLRGLVAERLCRIDREVGPGVERFDIYHDVLRQHLLERLAEGERRALHGAIAEAKIATAMPNDEIARHLLGAGDPRARGYVEAAAEEAVRVLAFDRAAGWLRHLLALGDPARERELRERLAECHRRAEDHVAAAEELERLAALQDPVTAGDTRRRAAEQWLTAGELERGLGALRALSIEGKLDGYRVDRHGALDFLAGRLRLRLRGTTAVRAKDVPTRPAPAVRNRVDLAWTIAGCFLLIDPFRAGAVHALGLTKALGIGDDERALRALVAEATYSGLYGRWSRRRTDRILEQIAALADELDDHHRALAMGTRAVVELERGNLDEGIALAPVALERLVAAPETVGWELMSVRHFYTYALFYLGDYRELVRHVEAEHRDASMRQNRHRTSDVSLHHATVAWLLSQGPGVARERARAASQFWDSVGPNVQRYYAAVSELAVALWEDDYAGAWRSVAEGPRVFLSAPLLVAEGLRADMLHALARAAVARAADVRTPASFATALGIIGVFALDASPLAAPLARLALAGLASAAGAPALADRIARAAAGPLRERGLRGYAALAGSVEGGTARVSADLGGPLARVLAPGLAPRGR